MRTACAVAVWLSVTLVATARAEPPVVSGRVFARQTLLETKLGDTVLPWRWEQAIASARLTVEYRYKKQLETALEVDFADGSGDLKDAYLRYRPARAWRLQMGRFKRPLSAIQLAGLWKLPVIERGLLSEIEFGGVALPMGGRADGLSLEWAPKRLPLSLQVAVFRPELLVALDATESFAADVYARAEMAIADGVTWGTSFAWIGYLEKPDQQRGYRHAPVVGFDVVVKRGWLRLWADVVTGIDILPFAIDVATLDLPCQTDEEGGATTCPPVERIADRGLMLAARAIASVRVPLRVGILRDLEPFVTASLVDFNVRFKDDEANELGVGVASRLDKRLRLQLQASRSSATSEAPVNEITRVMVQLGAVF